MQYSTEVEAAAREKIEWMRAKGAMSTFLIVLVVAVFALQVAAVLSPTGTIDRIVAAVTKTMSIGK